MNILDLLSDILVEIWYYLAARDVVRFGMVCKAADKISWSSVRRSRVKQPDLLNYVLSRDLSRISALEVYMTSDTMIGSIDLDIYQQTLKKFSNLAGATNLTSLVLVLAIGGNYPELEIVQDTVAKLTNLNMLHLAFDSPKEEFDLGEAFKNHHALTRLGLYCTNICRNFSQLTQLKTLDLEEASFRKDGPLIQISTTLTNLTEFIIGDVELVSPENLEILSNLTNLEAIRLSECHSPKFLLHLPKLTELGVSFVEFYDVGIIQQLTNLTSLSLIAYRDDVNFNASTLTNLKGLVYRGPIGEIDFFAMKQLTSLSLYPRRHTFKITSLPPNIQLLQIPTTSVHAEHLEAICNHSTLTYLNVREFGTKELHLLSKLTNLESFGINAIRPEWSDLPLHLHSNLKFLQVVNLPLGSIPDVCKFTQLCSFSFSATLEDVEQAKEEFRNNAPFRVIFEGDEQYN